MSLKYNESQKSPKRRFLLILGIATFVCVTIAGVMIMLDVMNLSLTPWQRYGFGALFVIYGAVRFSRLLKKDPLDE